MRIFKRAGSPYWWLTYNAHGRRVRESTHCTRKADAEIFLGKRQVELFEGKHFPEKRRTGLTVEEMRVLWFATKGRDKKSRIDDEHRFKVIVEHFGVGRQVAAIKPAGCRSFHGGAPRHVLQASDPLRAGHRQPPSQAVARSHEQRRGQRL